MDSEPRDFLRIKNLETFLSQIPSGHDLTFRPVFRGQEKDYPLVPSLFRKGHACIGEHAKWKSYEQKIIGIFKREAVPALIREPVTDLEWIALAQHHGVPTRTLDWSFSALTALFFAVESLSKHDGVVWSYYPVEVRYEAFKSFKELNEMQGVMLFLPRHEDQRMAAQSGALTLHPLPKNNRRFVPFGPDMQSKWSWTKFIIPKAFKREILSQLDDLGVNAYSIYPDLDGLGRKIRQRIHRFKSRGPDVACVSFTQKII